MRAGTGDRQQDQLQRLDEVTSRRFASRFDAVDRALAALAGAIGRLPIVQRGERPQTHR